MVVVVASLWEPHFLVAGGCWEMKGARRQEMPQPTVECHI